MIGNKCLLTAALALAPLVTQAAETVYTFQSITGVEHVQGRFAGDLLVTGVLVGDSTPTTVRFAEWSDSSGTVGGRCQILLHGLILEPSAPYTFNMTMDTNTRTNPDGSVTLIPYFKRCALVR